MSVIDDLSERGRRGPFPVRMKSMPRDTQTLRESTTREGAMGGDSLLNTWAGAPRGRTGMTEDDGRDRGERSLQEHPRQRYSGRSHKAARLSAGEIAGLVSELEAHQIELEIQNEELERARRELDEARRRYLDLYDFAPVGYLTISDKGIIVETNLTFCSMTGRTRNDLIRHRLSQLIVAEDRDAYYGFMHTLRAQEREGALDARIMRTDGSVFWAGIRCVPARAEGEDLRFQAAIADITEQKAAEEKLRQGEQRFGALFESTSDFIHLLNTETIILETNQRALLRLGYHPEEFVGRPLDEFFTEESRQRFREHFARFLEGAPYHQEAEVVCKDGTTIPVDCQAAAVREQDGRVAFCVFIQRDISSLEEAEEKHRNLAEELNRRNEDLRHFTSIIRHDFGNPVMSIQSFGRELGVSLRQIEHLLEEQHLQQHVRQRLWRILRQDVGPSLQFIEDSAAEITALLEGITQLATVGTVPLKIEAVDVNALMEHVISSMQSRIEASNAEVIVEPLPPCRGDSVQLGHVFTHLVGNAVKFLDEKRPGRIHVRGEIRDGRSIYCVEDNGIGMTPDQKERAFDVFYRGQMKPEARGQGLGLAIVERILNRLDGLIRVESEPRKGSRFFVSLPSE